MVLRLLELFSGTGSVGVTFRKVYKDDIEIISLDIHPKYHPQHCTDILKWDYKSLYPRGYFDIIWASPPCTEYSKAKTIGIRDFKLADSIVKRTFSIINYFKPTHWFLENPGACALLEKRIFMKKYEKYINRCTYCMYGTTYKKPTNIWSNVINLELKYCNIMNQCKGIKKNGGKQHISCSQKGYNTFYKNVDFKKGTKLKHINKIPEKLIKHIIRKII
jgi:hypothetical protein